MKIISNAVLIFVTSVAANNFELSLKYLKNEILYEKYISLYDTSVSATKLFIEKSEKNNIDSIKKIGIGPIEFYQIVDSVINRFSKGDQISYKVIRSMNKSVDGYIADDYSMYIRKYCNLRPKYFKMKIIEEGEASDIIEYFLYDSGGGWIDEPFITKKSKYNSKIIEYMKKYIKNEK